MRLLRDFMRPRLRTRIGWDLYGALRNVLLRRFICFLSRHDDAIELRLCIFIFLVFRVVRALHYRIFIALILILILLFWSIILFLLFHLLSWVIGFTFPMDWHFFLIIVFFAWGCRLLVVRELESRCLCIGCIWRNSYWGLLSQRLARRLVDNFLQFFLERLFPWAFLTQPLKVIVYIIEIKNSLGSLQLLLFLFLDGQSLLEFYVLVLI